MGKLIDGDDGLHAEDVGVWASGFTGSITSDSSNPSGISLRQKLRHNTGG